MTSLFDACIFVFFFSHFSHRNLLSIVDRLVEKTGAKKDSNVRKKQVHLGSFLVSRNAQIEVQNGRSYAYMKS